MHVVLATGSYDYTIRFWDVSSETCTHVVQFGKTVNSLAVSPDRRMLLAAGFGGSALVPLDTSQRQAQALCEAPCNVTQAIFLAGRAAILSACENGIVLYTDQRTWQTSELVRQKAAINAIAHLPGTDCVVTGDQRGLLKLWDLRRTQEPVSTTVAFEYDVGVRTLAISSHNGVLACGDARGILQTYSVSAGRAQDECLRPMACIQAHADMISNVSVSVDGQYIGSSSADKSCKIWKFLPNDTLVRYLAKTQNESTVWGCAFSADTKYFVTAADRVARLWNMEQTSDEQQHLKVFAGHQRFVTCVALGDSEN